MHINQGNVYFFSLEYLPPLWCIFMYSPTGQTDDHVSFTTHVVAIGCKNLHKFFFLHRKVVWL